MVLRHCSKSCVQLPSILCAPFSNRSVTDSIWIWADDAYFLDEIYFERAQSLIVCWERVLFDRHCLSVTLLIFRVTDFVSAIKRNVSVDLWYIFFVRLSIKIGGLDLAPFSEMVENHCSQSKKNVNHHNILLSYFLVRMIKPGLWYCSDLKRTEL